MRFWTSDHHIGHENIIGFVPRPFRSMAEMCAVITERWCELVGPDDEVWMIGDIAMGNREETVPFFRWLPGRKILIPGNHDSCWPGGKKSWREWLELYEQNDIEVRTHEPGGTIETEIAGVTVSVCHFPPFVDRHGDRYSAWRPKDEGQVFIHGHTHQSSIGDGRLVHVGVDAWDFWPVTDLWLAEQIKGCK